MLPPLSWVALFFISGLVFAEYSHITLSTSATIMAVTTATWVVLSLIKNPCLRLVRKNQFFGLSPVLILFVFLSGILRIQIESHHSSQNDLVSYNDKGIVTITGDIYGFPDRHDTYQLLTVKVDHVTSLDSGLRGVPVFGRVIVRTGITNAWAYGDSIQLTGRLDTPSDEADFSYREYLAMRSIGSSLYYPEIVLIARGGGFPLTRWIFSLRDKALVILEKMYPTPESALLSGILLGVDNGIPEDIQKAFRATGTTHIIAISGFNISILAALISGIFYKLLGARKGAVATVISLTLYVILTGASPSVIRAAIMGSLGLFASLVGRRQTGINSLAFVAAAMCLVNPFLPWDVSFQLSFFSTLGLILFADPMVNWLKRSFARLLPAHSLEHVAERIGEYCLFTLAALITTFPVMAFHFQAFSWSSLITNPLILPAQPAVMILGGLSLILGLIWFPLGKLVSYLSWPFVTYTIRIIEWFSSLTDNSSGSLSVGIGFIIFYYLILVILVTNKTYPLFRRLVQPALLILLGVAVTAYAWRSALSLPDGKLHIYLFDNGPSENLLLRSPAGEYLLLNAGSKSSSLASGLGNRLPPTVRHLDYVFIPVSDKSAIRALRHGISGIGVNNLIWLGDPSGLSLPHDLQKNIEAQVVSALIDQERQDYQLASGISMLFTGYGEAGGLFIVEWKSFRALIPIHIDDASWLEAVLASDHTGNYSAILLAGDGESELNPPSLIKRLNPSLILVNSDPDEPGTSPALGMYDDIILTTGQNGWVHLTTDGVFMWIEAARNTE